MESFRADLAAARAAARRYGLTLESLVFSRNQFNSEYLAVCRAMGIRAYRGNDRGWVYRPEPRKDESYLKRGLRLLDSYFNLFSHNRNSLEELAGESPYNLPASRFLRPCGRWPGAAGRLRRIRNNLSHAAAHGLVYHTLVAPAQLW